MPTRLSPLIAAVLAILLSSFSSLARAQTTIYSYGSQGQPTGSFETQGIVTGFTYDTGIDGLVVGSENNGTSTLTEYDSNGNVLQSTPTPQPLGPLMYDTQNGNVVGVGPGFGNVTLYSYDGRNRQTMTEQVPLPNNDGISNGDFVPGINDVIIGSPDRLGITTEYQYDSNFRLQGEFDVMGDATSIVFDPDTQDYFVASDVAGTEELLAYDSNGNFLESLDSIGAIDFNSGSGPNGLALGDFAGEGKLDIAVADQNSGSASVLTNISISAVAGQPFDGVTASFTDTLPNVDQANFAGIAVNPTNGAVFIAVTPEASGIWLFAPGLCLIVLLWAAGSLRAKRIE
jgi:YD repeat-containing protein